MKPLLTVETEQNSSLVRNLIAAGMSQGDEATVQFEGVGIHQPDGLNGTIRTAFCPVTKVLILPESHRVGIYTSVADEKEIEAVYDPSSCEVIKVFQGRRGFALVETHVRWRGRSIYLANAKLQNFKRFGGSVNLAKSYLESGVILVN